MVETSRTSTRRRSARSSTLSSALLRAALRRLWHDRLVVVAAAVLVVVGLLQLAAAPIYAEAVTLGSLRWSVEAAPAELTTATVEVSTAAATLDAIDEVVDDVVAATVPRDIPLRTFSRRLVTNSFEFGDGGAPRTASGPVPGEDRVELTVLASVAGIEDRAELVDGRWPRPGDGDGDGPLAAVLEARVADRLGLALGDVVDLTPRQGGPEVAVRLVGRYRRLDDAGRFWTGDRLLATGLDEGRTFRTHGPFVVAESDLASGRGGRLTARWLVDPDLAGLDVEGAERIRRRVDALPDRLEAAADELPEDVRSRLSALGVTTGLGPVLAGSARSVEVTRSGVLAVAAQLTVLAGVALAIGAGLLVDARRAQTAVFRARGAGRAHLTALAGIEALLLVAPAALAAPGLAVAVLRLLGRWGPLSSIGFAIEPAVGGSAVAAVAIAAVAMVMLLVAPVARSAPAGDRGAGAGNRHRRQHRRTGVQRAGLDVVLVAATAAAFWQLGRLGTGARSVLGDRFAIDPLLAVAPALALATGAVVTLRLIPLLARGAEWFVARGRSIVATLTGWQLARRPTDQARSVFLLVLALAIGGFAAAYAATWRSSQADQALQRLGADVVVRPDRRTGESIEPMELVDTHRQAPGVATVMPVLRASGSLPASDEPATILALDAAAASRVVPVDARGRDLTATLAPLVDQRPDLPGVELPSRPARLQLTATAREELVEVPTVDDQPAEPGADEPVPDEPGPDEAGQAAEPEEPRWLPIGFDGWLDAVFQDGDGLIHRRQLGRLTANTGPTSFDLDLRRTTDPLRLVALEIRLPIPEAPSRSVSVEIGPLSVIDEAGGASTVSLAGPGGDGGPTPWTGSAVITARLRVATGVEVVDGADGGLGLAIDTGATSTPGLAVLDLRPGPAELPDTLPVVVDRSWLTATGVAVGDRVDLPALGLANRGAMIVGAIDGFPSVDPTTDLTVVADLASLQVLALEPGRRIEEVDELWLALDEGADRDGLAAALLAAPYSSVEVADREALTAALRADPVALAAIGAYVIGAGAAAVFAVVVFVTTAAMSARQRRQEFVLLRALGLAPRQFAGWLAVEQFVLLGLAVVISTALGLGLSLAVLPRLLLDRDGRAVVPPPEAVIPWRTVAAVQLVPVLALVAVVVVGSIGIQRRALAGDLRTGDEG